MRISFVPIAVLEKARIGILDDKLIEVEAQYRPDLEVKVSLHSRLKLVRRKSGTFFQYAEYGY